MSSLPYSCTFGLGAILRVPKNGFIYVEADTNKLYAGL